MGSREKRILASIVDHLDKEQEMGRVCDVNGDLIMLPVGQQIGPDETLTYHKLATADKELAVMGNVWDQLSQLDNDAKQRVVTWVESRLKSLED